MKFHLDISVPAQSFSIQHQDQTLMIGSCFSEHIYHKLHDLKFNVHSNPFGIVFNPESIFKQLTRIVTKQYFTKNDILEKQQQYVCLDAHSQFTTSSPTLLLDQLNHQIDAWHEYLCHANTLFITFGSAFAYVKKDTQLVVANCHKIPQNYFNKQLLTSSSLVAQFHTLYQLLLACNPTLQIVLTVSPVKHLKDGVVENNLSKSILIQTTHQLVSELAHCSYFPSYELVADDLRDYRFYEKDLAHPNSLAVDYVWQKFAGCYFNNHTMQLNQRLLQIYQAYHHKLFNEQSAESIQFKKDNLQKCLTLQEEFPFLNLQSEMVYFKSV